MDTHGRRLRTIPLSVIAVLGLLLIAGCRLVLTPGDGGTIVSASGLNDCDQTECIISNESGIEDTFTAVPNNGYEFAGWQGFCDDDLACEVSLPPDSLIQGLFGFSTYDLPLEATWRTVNTEPEVLPEPGDVVLSSPRDFGSGSSACGLAFDQTQEYIWVHGCSAAYTNRFDTAGNFAGVIVSSGEYSAGETANDVDLDISPASFLFHNTQAAPGDLFFINGETGTSEIYLLDSISGFAKDSLAVDFGASHVVGGTYHAGRNSFFLIQDSVPGRGNGNLVAEIDPRSGAVKNSFYVSPEFSIYYGDVDVCQSTGNLFFVSSSESSIAEFTPAGSFVAEYALPEGVNNLSGIDFDDDSGDAWVVSTRGLVSKLEGMRCLSYSPPTAGPALNWNRRILYRDKLAWASNRDLSSSKFAELFDEYSDKGYLIIDVDARTDSQGQTTFAMVWQDNVDGRKWKEHRNLTSTEYNDYWTQYKAEGYRPLDVEAYMYNGSLHYAGIWIENREGLAWSSKRNLTSEEYATYFQERKAAGMIPIDIEAYQTSNGLRYAAIWYENVEGVAWAQLRNMDRTTYQAEADSYTDQGYLLVDYESYPGSSEQLYAAIWEKPQNRPAFQVRTDRNQVGYANNWREYLDAGYRIVDFENYNKDGNSRYGGIWIENADRFRYARKDDVTDDINTYFTADQPVGMSVALILNGQVIYRRGFGMADANAGKVAHGGTIYNLASVSKVIGSTLAAKLEDEGQLRDGTSFSFDMTKPTSDYLTEIPAQHTHTVEQLTAHLACIAHYPQSTNNGVVSGTVPGISDGTMNTTHYSTALAAVKDMWNTGLVTTTQAMTGCTIGSTRSYSTHAFTFLGAVLEEATGRSLNQLLEDELFKPYHLGSLRVLYADPAIPYDYDRSVLYNNGNPWTRSDNSYKVIGGGMESSAVDLARFGWKVLAGEIVDETSRDTRMWSPVAGGTCNWGNGGVCRYGVGWDLAMRNGRRSAEHEGSWTGARSLLRVYPDDGLVIAIIQNTRTTNLQTSLANTLANTVLNP